MVSLGAACDDRAADRSMGHDVNPDHDELVTKSELIPLEPGVGGIMRGIPRPSDAQVWTCQ